MCIMVIVLWLTCNPAWACLCSFFMAASTLPFSFFKGFLLTCFPPFFHGIMCCILLIMHIILMQGIIISFKGGVTEVII